MTDSNGNVLDINKGCEKLIGLPQTVVSSHSES